MSTSVFKRLKETLVIWFKYIPPFSRTGIDSNTVKRKLINLLWRLTTNWARFLPRHRGVVGPLVTQRDAMQ